MLRNPLMRIAAAAVGGMAAAAVLLAVIFVVNADGGFAGSTAATPMGWTIPLIAGVMVGGLAWLLLADSHAQEPSRGEPPHSVACATCGKSCLETWRLCPHCGTLIGEGRNRS